MKKAFKITQAVGSAIHKVWKDLCSESRDSGQVLDGPARSKAARNPKRSKAATGELHEAIVLRELQQRGFELVMRRWRTPFAELDLVVRRREQSRDQIWVIEVKSQARGRLVSEFPVLRFAQRQRLEKALLWLNQRYADQNRNCTVRFSLAVVGENHRLDWFHNILETQSSC